ncbi:MAG: hypothetical protein WAM71_04135 [Candidatus Korobacteraceae bacterium]
MKQIRLSAHAKEQAIFRGTTQSEIEDAIASTTWGPASNGRLECKKNLPFDSTWNGRSYSTKQVRPVFVDEPSEIVVVTVYVYYF